MLVLHVVDPTYYDSYRVLSKLDELLIWCEFAAFKVLFMQRSLSLKAGFLKKD